MIGVQIYYSRHFKNYNQFQHCCRKARLIRQQGFASVAFNGGSEPKKVEVINTESKDSPLLAYVLYPGFPLNPKHYASFLQSCGNVEFLKQAHSHMVVFGLDHDIYLQTKLLSMYTSFGILDIAQQLFDKMYEPNVHAWNAMIRGYATSGYFEEALFFYYQMQKQAGIQADKMTFPFVLKACARFSSLQEGMEIHCHIVKSGFEADVFVRTALVNMYVKCGVLEDARRLFDKMSQRTVVSWTAMIAGYACSGEPHWALKLFNQMQATDVKPNPITVASVLPAYANLKDLEQGKWIHDYVIRNNFESNVLVGNELISMYLKFGSIENALKVFDKVSQGNEVSWTAMIAGCSQNGYAGEVLALFHRMKLESIKPNSYTLVSFLSACGHLAALQKGKWIHGYIIKCGFETDVFVGTALIDMYAKCGSIDIAQQFLDKMFNRNLVSWNALIAGYAQNGHNNQALFQFRQMQLTGVAPDSITMNGHDSEALMLFNQMRMVNVKPDSITMVSLLTACAHVQNIQQGKRIHNFIIRNGFELDVSVGTALIDMYANCGNIHIARHLFNKLSVRNVVSWNAMIAGYAHHGLINEVLILFHQMQLADIAPDSVTLMSVLSACGQLGALQHGKCIHNFIVRKGLEIVVCVGNSLLAMYAKCGKIKIAREVFDLMYDRNVVSWSSMIGGYGIHGHGKEALKLFCQMQQAGINPNHVTFLGVLLACSHTGMLDDGCHYFDCMSGVYSIVPRVEHYACMVDLLGRAGCLDEAFEFIHKMPLEPDSGIWGALLGACRIHSNVEMGEYVAKQLSHLEPENPGYYVLLSNIYAAVGRWDEEAKMRTIMKDRQLKKTPGCTSIELNNKLQSFVGGDRTHPQSEKIYATLEILAGQMKEAGYTPDKSFVLHDVEEEEKINMLGCHSEKLAIAFGLINTVAGTTIKITKNLRVCGDCHNATKFISKIVMRDVVVRDATRFHHFENGLCTCGDYW
ncbi:pentatricopeptide repeat-containing protein At3g26782, mitochondrial [Cryptomeria japonica]|uniref:pentatricopeptide repeat-containing protein At3g26782, mitochondrial n=1 Tax=Cryptomeria japonica TaxID=3369 RepID=UPI0027DA1BE9|nr:pentatricopeptide repeat-containing protein At3g26782, mitochondrial [Cryptomeria japonica]